jgi:hypothetical protein
MLTSMCPPHPPTPKKNESSPQLQRHTSQFIMPYGDLFIVDNSARVLMTCCIWKASGTAGRENKGGRLHYRDTNRTYQTTI